MTGKRNFAHIDRLPPYVFNITAELKLAVRRRGVDIVDMSVGNPDGAMPPYIVEKLNEVAPNLQAPRWPRSNGLNGSITAGCLADRQHSTC